MAETLLTDHGSGISTDQGWLILLEYAGII
jgi:hypothetical protein